MGTIMDTAILPMLEQLRLHALPDPAHDAVVVPFESIAPASGTQLVILRADEGLGEVFLFTQLGTVPPARRAAVALLLARLNTRYTAVTFGMDEEGRVILDAHAELAYAADRVRMVGVAFARLHRALLQAGPDIVNGASARGGKPRATKMEKELAALMTQFEGGG